MQVGNRKSRLPIYTVFLLTYLVVFLCEQLGWGAVGYQEVRERLSVGVLEAECVFDGHTASISFYQHHLLKGNYRRIPITNLAVFAQQELSGGTLTVRRNENIAVVSYWRKSLPGEDVRITSFPMAEHDDTWCELRGDKIFFWFTVLTPIPGTCWITAEGQNGETEEVLLDFESVEEGDGV